MYAKIIIILVLVILCTGCTDPDLPDPYKFENVTPGAPALKKLWDSETQTITISTLDDTPRLTIRKISAVPDLCTFEEVLEIKSFVDYDLNKLKDFRARWQKHKGQHDITKVEWFILKNESHDISVDDYEIIQVEETHYNNETDEYYNATVNQTVLIGNHPEVRYHDVWKPFSPVGKSIHAGQTYTVKIVYHKPPELGNVRVQTIPMFAGIECDELTWWNTSWNYRRNITINHSMVDAVMTNFPVMVSITQSGLNTDGNDTRITDSSDNQVAREIECYNSTSGELVFFFNSTSISNIADTSFWMYYNNSAATEPAADSTYGSQAVWTGYDVVYNMAQVPASLIDSTSNNRDITTVAGSMGSEDLIDGNYGKGIAFDSNDGVKSASCGNIGTGDFAATIKFSGTSFTDPQACLFSNRDSSTAKQFAMRTTVNDYNDFTTYDGAAESKITTSTPAVNDGNEHTMTARRVGTSLKIYIDGVERADGTLTVRNIATTQQYTVGYNGAVGYSNSNIYLARNYIGTMSVNYILTIHKNLHNPTATGTDPFFLSFGTEESASIITAYSPSTPLSKTTGDSQLFTINTSENSQCRWYINSSLKQTNSTGATRHEYTNSSLEEGYWNFTATANTTDMTSSQTWWVTVSAVGTFGQDMYIDRWMYATYLNDSNTNLSEFFTDLSPYYLSFYNATDQKTYNYKSGRWEKYADKIIKPGEAAMLRYTSNVTKTRDNAAGTFGFTMKTGPNHIGHSYNGTRNLTWYNTTISSANLVTITHQNPETSALSTFTYGSADNGSVDVLQGFGVEVNVSADTVISGL